jgi:1-acyl-sn-glycerol-3-phosphate acyltransferase
MWNFIAQTIFKIAGWKFVPNPDPAVNRSVMIAAPHTSNWDLLYALAAFKLMNLPVRFTIKKEWMIFPVGPFLAYFGAIPIDRSPKVPGQPRKSMVEAMAEIFAGKSKISVMVTPEGTRSLRTEWKTGFYYVAKEAGVPIALGYLDYAKKEAGVGPLVYPSDNMEADMRKIMDFYAPIPGKFPEKFSVDVRYHA